MMLARVSVSACAPPRKDVPCAADARDAD